MDEKIRKKQIRWRLLIYPKFQVTLILVNLTSLLLGFGVIGFFVYQNYLDFIEMGKVNSIASSHSYYRFIEYQNDKLFFYLLMAFLVTTILFSLSTLILTHKVSGPIVKLKGFLKRLSEGQKEDAIRFRKNDFFQDLPPLINRALGLDKKIDE